MSQRPSLDSLAQSSTSEQVSRHRPVSRLYPLFAQLSFHVLPGKLDGQMGQIYDMIDDLGGKCVRMGQARFILTALRGRPRIERAIGNNADTSSVVLDVEYVQETFRRCVEAASRGVLPKLPPRNDFIRLRPFRERVLGDSVVTGASRKRRRSSSAVHPKHQEETSDAEDIALLDPDIKLQDIPRYCVERPCPLVCVNQDIINAIKPIYDEREYEESQQKNSNVLSYRRSMSILKSVPRRIKSGKEAMKLQDLGEKVAHRIDEFLQTGHIKEAEEILASPRYQAFKVFSSVYTIGHHTARELYDKHHCRTLEDVRQHYQNIAEESEEVRLKVKERRKRQGGMLHVDIVEEWIKLKPDLDTSIPRTEVEEIAACVMEHLDAILPGCQYTITGGYRRGKPMSNDVDIVFCPPNEDEDVGLLHDLYLRLSTLGIITHVLHVTHREKTAPIKASPNNFDNLDKAFVILRLPGTDRKHRRVDLISAPKERYAAAVLSWSGSMMFERDLRRYAEDRGYKFRAGLRVANTGEEINFETERQIFQHLGLKYVPPELRNADG
ncbi:hypothetical protein DB88DRAFT_490154 [Papiliotrema laurentii]|uniref:DNA polymerase n=1 Tax=Papiliotrema laurentii TaxID=5418 RepID=A0AAD9D1A0_PAPLA|nr:hypothetical protein DB88DRAFT_490154 [Papiliotrema laurentii]